MSCLFCCVAFVVVRLEVLGRVSDWDVYAACVLKPLLTVNGKWSFSWSTVCIKTAGKLPNAVTLVSTISQLEWKAWFTSLTGADGGSVVKFFDLCKGVSHDGI